MSCKCIEETEERMKQRMGDSEMASFKPKKDAQIKTVSCVNISLMFKEGKCRLTIPFRCEWASNTGKEIKPTTVDMLASHCPFCGQPFEETAKEEGV